MNFELLYTFRLGHNEFKISNACNLRQVNNWQEGSRCRGGEAGQLRGLAELKVLKNWGVERSEDWKVGRSP